MCDKIVEKKSYVKINRDFKRFTRKPNLKLPLIRLYYGPLATNGFIKHKPQKLHGLVACLKKLHYDVEMIPAAHLNILKVVILGYEVYGINTKFLEFNIDCCFDSVCPVVVEKIEEAISRLYNDSNISKHFIWRYENMNEDLSWSSESESYYTMS